VYLDAGRLSGFPSIRGWFLRELPKQDQDLDAIVREFRKAGPALFGTQRVQVDPEFIRAAKKTHAAIVLCPSCGEACQSDLGDVCPACRGEAPFQVTG
jgi:formylmethanofuran dehydrogenase subunit E